MIQTLAWEENGERIELDITNYTFAIIPKNVELTQSYDLRKGLLSLRKNNGDEFDVVGVISSFSAEQVSELSAIGVTYATGYQEVLSFLLSQ
jgi:hypothetical protein